MSPSINLLNRVRSEFIEMPGLRLRIDQAQRLWNLDRASCETVLLSLVEAKFLRRDTNERYARALASVGVASGSGGDRRPGAVCIVSGDPLNKPSGHFLCLQNLCVDRAALIEIQAEPREILQPQIAVAVDLRIGQIRLQVGRPAGVIARTDPRAE